MRFHSMMLATAAAVAMGSYSYTLYAAEVDVRSETNVHAQKSHAESVPNTGVNVGNATLGKNTVSKQNSKVGMRARGYNPEDPASDGLPVGGNNADPGSKNSFHDDHDHDHEHHTHD